MFVKLIGCKAPKPQNVRFEKRGIVDEGEIELSDVQTILQVAREENIGCEKKNELA